MLASVSDIGQQATFVMMLLKLGLLEQFIMPREQSANSFLIATTIKANEIP